MEYCMKYRALNKLSITPFVTVEHGGCGVASPVKSALQGLNCKFIVYVLGSTNFLLKITKLDINLIIWQRRKLSFTKYQQVDFVHAHSYATCGMWQHIGKKIVQFNFLYIARLLVQHKMIQPF